ncbi:hypothetical protein HanIR_Chr17g0856211 [Helianthus annuus]|uniref:Uncharacterized protein n=1 Tax=Helianthus annuus TaxID=4232 RepID=A0A251RRL8_HELAN|nr:hypothetical protein HanIR_Chr17g0856211 [Helianthus annuus]
MLGAINIGSVQDQTLSGNVYLLLFVHRVFCRNARTGKNLVYIQMMKGLKNSSSYQVYHDCHLPVIFPPLEHLSSTLPQHFILPLSTFSSTLPYHLMLRTATTATVSVT